jgi:hypothetical protein
MHTSEQINELAAALAKAQGEIKGAAKDSANPFFKAKYADLASVWDACRVALTRNGLSVTQTATADGARVSVETRLLHASGQWLGDTLTVTAKEDSPQAIGSAITYARRYGLAAITGVAPEDDDGEAAQARSKPAHHAAPPPDRTAKAAEALVEKVQEEAPKGKKPAHVVALYNRILRQQAPKGADGAHTDEQKAYAAKLMQDAAAMFKQTSKPSSEWSPADTAILEKHLFGGKPETDDVPF